MTWARYLATIAASGSAKRSRTMIEVTTATAPAVWASLLVNGDDSGLDQEDAEAAKAWELSLAPWRIVGIDDSEDAPGGFMRWHDAAEFCPLAADCVAYVLHKDKTE
ncbi:hypothetical protein [Synechococcus virus S-ESS1]|uniref:Uncharacterized protein n=1 Tax=Synechococcus virus S-ESS1 TaxID=1964565 RepID=A0A1V0DX77_9CAUD|nr:hypothetical protein JT310_gp50 [Synechococcus virus S-ESS1]ARB05737.1 hypothetical protein [Synechococcus virus S-ESS1]